MAPRMKFKEMGKLRDYSERKKKAGREKNGMHEEGKNTVKKGNGEIGKLGNEETALKGKW